MLTVDNLNPTPSDVLEWGYDEELFFLEQDEDLLLDGLDLVDALVELAIDSNCPKRSYATAILGQFSREAALRGQSEYPEVVRKALSLDAAETQDQVIQLKAYVHRLITYQDQTFRPNETIARQMADDLLLGVNGQGNVLYEGEDPQFWHFTLTTSYSEYLYIEKANGQFRHSKYRRPE